MELYEIKLHVNVLNVILLAGMVYNQIKVIIVHVIAVKPTNVGMEAIKILVIIVLALVVHLILVGIKVQLVSIARVLLVQ
jgi:hypothetical protein